MIMMLNTGFGRLMNRIAGPRLDRDVSVARTKLQPSDHGVIEEDEDPAHGGMIARGRHALKRIASNFSRQEAGKATGLRDSRST